MEESHISVMAKVRVRSKPYWHKAIISVVEEDRCEVIDLYSENEKWVPRSDIEPLFDFESTMSKDPEKLKVEGNTLFKLPDPHSAWQRYHRGRLICDELPSINELIGCEVLHQGNIGMVSDVDESNQIAEVCFDDEDKDCSIQDLTRVFSQNGKLQCSLYSNESMALFKLGKFSNCLKLCNTLQILSSHFNLEIFQQKAAFWKCKCHIRKRKFQLASKSLILYESLGGKQKQCVLLESEIHRSQKQHVQSNKRLAKEIAKWTDQVLRKKETEENGTMEAALEEETFSEEESDVEPSKMTIFCTSFCQYFCAIFMILLLLSQLLFAISSKVAERDEL